MTKISEILANLKLDVKALCEELQRQQREKAMLRLGEHALDGLRSVLRAQEETRGGK